MPQNLEKMRPVDPIWECIREEAHDKIQQEPLLASFLHASVRIHESLEECLSLYLARKLGSPMLTEKFLYDVMIESMLASIRIGTLIRSDLQAFRERDPACNDYCTPLLYFQGFHALEAFRIGHSLWIKGRTELALYLQQKQTKNLHQ